MNFSRFALARGLKSKSGLVAALTLIVGAAAVAPASAANSGFEGASSDGTRVFFSTTDRLDPVADTDAVRDVYQRFGGVTTLISGDGDGAFAATYFRASSDGTRVFFRTAEALDPDGDTDGGAMDIYQRLGGVTTLISGDTDGGFNAEFEGASSDGTRVFFSTNEQLDPVADTDGVQDVYQRSGGVTTLISGDGDGFNPAGFGGASSDGTRVFFTTGEQLDPVADVDGQQDVYQRFGGVTSLISGDADGAFGATYAGASSDGARVFFTTGEPLDPVNDTDGTRIDVYQRYLGATSFVSGDASGAFDAAFVGLSSDGIRMFFATAEPLIPAFDTDSQQIDIYQRSQFFNDTALISGDTDGAFAATFGGASSDGSLAFFTTQEALDPGADTDGTGLDVYQRLANVTTLVSGDADGAFHANYVGTSSDGSRVLFQTQEPLDPTADTDSFQYDVYERSGGVTTLISGDADGAFHALHAGNSADASRVFFETNEPLESAVDGDVEQDVYQRSGGATTLISRAADPVVTTPAVNPAVAGPTGKRAAALKKCKKKRTSKARASCKRKAKKLPV